MVNNHFSSIQSQLQQLDATSYSLTLAKLHKSYKQRIICHKHQINIINITSNNTAMLIAAYKSQVSQPHTLLDNVNIKKIIHPN